MTQAATILRTGRKFDQVLRGARDVFMSDGFEGANVDDIARAAGVSKATLYSYFPDKRLLFVEVAQTECQLMAERILAMVDETRPVREVLTITATQLVAFLTSDFAQQVFRICLAERERFPELARAFYAAGPENGQRQICEYLEKAVEKGELVIRDIPMAAEQFSELCKTRLWTRAVFGIQTRFSQAEIDEVALAAVDTFLARYGA
ncbi:TetR/AcrR family transcriptional regulator [Ruegeria pomeroyi]|nr:TetR/AcrR family transcriptional regulator [Ruegeria pomeroyi]MCE8552747.1 TetR/AcrR family transcriptional regulator [Ruegeria pomeroyi]